MRDLRAVSDQLAIHLHDELGQRRARLIPLRHARRPAERGVTERIDTALPVRVRAVDPVEGVDRGSLGVGPQPAPHPDYTISAAR